MFNQDNHVYCASDIGLGRGLDLKYSILLVVFFLFFS